MKKEKGSSGCKTTPTDRKPPMKHGNGGMVTPSNMKKVGSK